jgi:hypothetical protein
LLQVPGSAGASRLPPSEIDVARKSALEKIKSDFRSKSTSCLVGCSDDDGASDPATAAGGAPSTAGAPRITVEKARRRSHEVRDEVEVDGRPKKLLTHRRSHSAAGLDRQNAFDHFDDVSPLALVQRKTFYSSSADFGLLEFPARKLSEDKEEKKPKAKSSTFPRQTTSPPHSTASPSMPATLGRKLMKTMSSPVKHLSSLLDVASPRYRSRRVAFGL